MFILMGDMNAKVGSNNTDREREMRRHDLGDKNENGEMLKAEENTTEDTWTAFKEEVVGVCQDVLDHS